MSTNHQSRYSTESYRIMDEKIKEKLTSELSPSTLIIKDQSHLHAAHFEAARQGGTHFKVRIVSSQFQGLSRVARHKKVYSILSELFEIGLHALALETKTPEEA